MFSPTADNLSPPVTTLKIKKKTNENKNKKNGRRKENAENE